MLSLLLPRYDVRYQANVVNLVNKMELKKVDLVNQITKETKQNFKFLMRCIFPIEFYEK